MAIEAAGSGKSLFTHWCGRLSAPHNSNVSRHNKEMQPMGTFFLVAALVATQPTLAAEDFSRGLAKCSADRNGITRLACYDALGERVSAQDPARSLTSTCKWKVQTETSKIDDSKNVTLSLEAESVIHGWPSMTARPELEIRCKERKTEAYIITGMAPSVEYGFNIATVTFRLDRQPAFKVATSKSTDGEALFIPQAANFAKRLTAGETLLFEFIPFNSSGQLTTFDIRGLGEALKSIRAACKW
jgi:type VI secretion system protein VasI